MKIIDPDNHLLSINEWAELQPTETGDDDMKLQRVEIDMFMGITHSEFTVGDGGVMFVGKSESNKSAHALAVYAALKSRGFGPEYIHDGAQSWRVLAKFDGATVQTTVRRNGRKEVKVDGLGLGSPQEKLDAVFPDLIDALQLAADKSVERRRKVLTAMFVAATAEDQKRWTGEDLPAPDPEKHGLDVVKGLHDLYYAKRAQANKNAKDAAATLKLAQDEAEHLAKPEHKGVVVPVPGKEDDPVREAEKAREALEQRRQQAEAMAKRTEGTRARIAGLVKQADAIRDAGPMVPPLRDVENANARLNLADVEVSELERKLEAARNEREEAKKALLRLEEQQRDANTATRDESQKRQQAAELEGTLAETAIAPPTDDELFQADAAVAQARVHCELVKAARAAHDALAKVCALTDSVAAADAEAARLDRIVKTLDNEATAELAARANLPAGVSFVDDDVALDGHVFKLLSDSKRTALCVDLVKRIAPDAKLLRLDRLECMDPDLRDDFIRRAKAGGYQIIGTVVERGEMRIVTIGSDDEGNGQDQAGETA
jgi:hypothetical protein